MNIIDIVKNAPEGATHYSPETHEFYLTYFKDNGCSYLVPTDSANEWVSKKRPLPSYEDALPLPKLKTEWVKVEDSIFHPQLQVDFESGELYRLAADGTYKDINSDELTLMTNLVGGYLYRKVERPIDESEAFEIKLDEIAKEHFNSGTDEPWASYLYNKGCRFIELD